MEKSRKNNFGQKGGNQIYKIYKAEKQLYKKLLNGIYGKKDKMNEIKSEEKKEGNQIYAKKSEKQIYEKRMKSNLRKKVRNLKNQKRQEKELYGKCMKSCIRKKKYRK